jgi:CubicO group peptidase (beta-lactamase class C family)
MTGQLDRRTALALLMAGAAMPSLARAQTPAGKVSPATLAALDAAAKNELEQKAIPSLAIALVDRSGVLWAGGWGFADEEKKVPATADTLYRTGAVGRIVTDRLLNELVAAKRVDIDKPVTAYVPDFAPKNPFDAPITVRHLAEHRSGLVRDPPAGSPYDLREATLEQNERALSRTELLFKPGSQVKYSDAGLNMMAQVVENAWGAPFAVVAQKKLFEPLGLTHSGYSPSQAHAVLAHAEIGSYDADRIPAPLTEPDAALGGLHTTANDLGKLIQATLAAGVPAGLDGGTIEGRPTLRQAGTVLGCTAEVLLAPADGLGVAVLGALNDCPSVGRLAGYAMALMLAERAGRAPAAFQVSQRLGMDASKALAGHYEDGGVSLFLRELGGGLYLEAERTAGEVRAAGGRHLIDSPLAYSDALEIDPQGRWAKLDGRTFRRSDWPKPPEPPAQLAGLIGDYGWEQGYVRIFERDGKPYARVGWADWEPLTQTGPDELSFGPGGRYSLEKLAFVRDEKGEGASLMFSGLAMTRRDFGGDMLARTRAMASNSKNLRAQAKKATPPQETGKDKPDLVPIRSADPTIKLDVRYAKTDNFMGFPLYAREGAYLERPAAQAVAGPARR